MSRTFTIPSRFHPARSPLGRWIAAQTDDRRQAESVYIVAAVGVALVLILTQFLSWTLVQPLEAREVALFLTIQAVVAGLYGLSCIAGRRPPILIEASDEGLLISCEDIAAEMPYRNITGMSTINAQVYYRHYARFAATRAFVNRIHPNLLLIRYRGVPVVLGLEPSDLVALRELLKEKSVRSSSRVA